MSPRVYFLNFAFVVVLTATATGQVPPKPAGGPGGDATLNLAASGVRVVVMYFAATDCPISNRYVPTIKRLDRAYGSKGLRVWWVYPNPTDDAMTVARHRKEFSITSAIFPGEPRFAVALAHATVTPEAAVFVVNSGRMREVYRGRVDNRYAAIGQERPQATRSDLEAAIEAALSGKPVTQPDGPPVGCAIIPTSR